MLLISCGYGGHGFRNTTTTEGSVWIGFGSYHHDSRVRLDWFRLTPPRPKGPFGLVMLTAHPKRVWVWFWLVCLGLHRDPTRVRLVCLLPTVAASSPQRVQLSAAHFSPQGRVCLFIRPTTTVPKRVRFGLFVSVPTTAPMGCVFMCYFLHQRGVYNCSFWYI